MYNPRFEEDFAAGRDYDPDRRALSADLKCCPVCKSVLDEVCCRKITSAHEAHCASAHEA